MAEWLYEAGIGEDRAILVELGEIVEAIIELPAEIRAGAVHEARLASILVPGRRGIVMLDGGGEALLEPLPPAIAEGARLRVEIAREALLESGRSKLTRARVSDEEIRPGETLAERIAAIGDTVVRPSAQGPDLFEQAGWSETLEQASTGEIPFIGGALRMSLTPAMTLFDVDGALPPKELAIEGARAAGLAIRRFDISGSIGLDLPTLAAKPDRQAAATALDSALPPPFERTAVNGFGFLQIIRRRVRPSLAEILQGDPVGAAARALLRKAGRAQGAGQLVITAAPKVIARIEQNEAWMALLSRSAGTQVRLSTDPGLSISAGHVHNQVS